MPEPPERDSGQQPDGESGSESAPQGKPGLPAPPPKPPPNLPVPPDVADAQDDDVVCRQIREAAVAETDAELREDLWDEYRRCREDR